MIPGRSYSGPFMIPGRSWQDHSKEICMICMVPVEEHLKTMKLCSDSFSLNDDSRICFVHACFTLVEKIALWFFFSS